MTSEVTHAALLAIADDLGFDDPAEFLDLRDHALVTQGLYDEHYLDANAGLDGNPYRQEDT